MSKVMERPDLMPCVQRASPGNKAIVQLLEGDNEQIISVVRMDSTARETITIGRHLDCSIVVDDPFVAARHCQIEFDAAGQLHVTDLGTVNGIRLDGQRVARAMVETSAPQILTLGRSRLRLRLRDHPLAPERPLSEQSATARADANTEASRDTASHRQYGAVFGFCLLAVLFLLQAGVETWFGKFNHDQIAHDIATAALSGLAFAAAWTSGWALLSRLVIGSPQWIKHASIALAGYLVGWSLYNLVGIGAFATSSVLSWTMATLVILVVCSFGVLYAHVRAATHLKRSTAMVCAALLPIAILGLSLTKLSGTEHSADATEISDIYLLPPSVRLRDPADVRTLLDDARLLKGKVKTD